MESRRSFRKCKNESTEMLSCWKRSSHYEAILLFCIHIYMLIKVDSICYTVKIFYGITSFFQIFLRILGYQTDWEYISRWFQSRNDKLSIGLNYTFYFPQIFLISLLINNETMYPNSKDSFYLEFLNDYLFFSYIHYILAVVFVLFQELVHQSKILYVVVFTATFFVLKMGLYCFHFTYPLFIYVFALFIYKGVKYIKYTWSFGELSIITSIMTLGLHFIVNHAKFSGRYHLRILLGYDIVQKLGFGLIFSNLVSILLIVLVIRIDKYYKSKLLNNNIVFKILLIILVLGVIWASIVTIVDKSLSYMVWWFIFDFMSYNHRWKQFAWCLFSTVQCIILNYLISFISPDHDKLITSANYLRKTFHIFVCTTLMPLLFIDFQFPFIATACLFTLFVLFELARISKVVTVTQKYYDLIKLYLNDRDVGDVIVSHINLLLGVSMPIWFMEIFFFDNSKNVYVNAYKLLLVNIGFVSIGIGDSVACCIGSFFGSQFKPVLDTKKSVVGTVASFISQTIAFTAIFYQSSQSNFYQLLFSIHFLNILLCSALSAALELLTTQNDNLVVPSIVFSFLVVSLPVN